MNFSKSFLLDVAKENQLTERELEVFINLFGEGRSRVEIASELYVQESAISSCLTGIYKKFGVVGRGPVKQGILKDILHRKEKIWEKEQSQLLKSSFQENFDLIFPKIREDYCKKMIDLYGGIRLLSGREVDVRQIYVDVWLLEKPERYFFNSPELLLKKFDIKEDRLALSRRISRSPGQEVAGKLDKLVVLGKPGSGKTTFLKHLAIDCCNKIFHEDLIPVFIELRKIKDDDWNLLQIIDEELGLLSWREFSEYKNDIDIAKSRLKNIDELLEDAKLRMEDVKKLRDEKKALIPELNNLESKLESFPLQIIMKEGRLLFFLDGFDEVLTRSLRAEISDYFSEVYKEYPRNRYILTCRTQVMESTPVGFTSVEVADFTQEQIGLFVRNWFHANGDTVSMQIERWNSIQKALSNRPELRELMATPVLLGLTCLVVQDEGEIPPDRNWLYKKGIRLLLSKWNDRKQIDGWEVGSNIYQNLTLEDKEVLLANLAATKFEDPKNDNFILFDQDELADDITRILRLNNRLEGLSVLKAIESQHGLLIERADELWSFSHFTFQEFFTVQWLIGLSSRELYSRIESQSWQDTMRQLVRSQQPADNLLNLIKLAIDSSVSKDVDIQAFLSWLSQKARLSQSGNYMPAVRSFYYALIHGLANRTAYTPGDRVRGLECDFRFTLDCVFSFKSSIDNLYQPKLDFALLRCAQSSTQLIQSQLINSKKLDFLQDIHLQLVTALKYALDISYRVKPELVSELQDLIAIIPDPVDSEYQKWWNQEGHDWLSKLRQSMMRNCSISEEIDFSEDQKIIFRRYYRANMFLMELLNIEGSVTASFRDMIESKIFLPSHT